MESTVSESSLYLLSDHIREFAYVEFWMLQVCH